jgi:hypothetical protein
VKEFEQMHGAPVEELVPEKDFEYVHYTTARNNMCMLENLGGEIAEVAGRRCTIGAFPWRWVGGEGCICRVVAFLDMDQPGIEGAEPPGAQPRQWDAGTTPARIMAGGQSRVSY